MRINKFRVFLILVVLLVSSGCANRYTYDGKSFASSEKALQAHRDKMNEVANGLNPISSTPKGNAIIITPSKKTCEALGVKTKGNPNKEIMNYLGQFLEEEFANFSTYLEKSRLFESVNHSIDDFPAQYANKVNKNYSATIYLDMKSQTQISWFIMMPPQYKPIQINYDKMAEVGAPKIQSWLNDINNHIQEGVK